MPTKKTHCRIEPKKKKEVAESIEAQDNISELSLVLKSKKPINSPYTLLGTGLLVATGHFQGKPVRILFDPVSDISYVSRDVGTSEIYSVQNQTFLRQ